MVSVVALAGFSVGHCGLVAVEEKGEVFKMKSKTISNIVSQFTGIITAIAYFLCFYPVFYIDSAKPIVHPLLLNCFMLTLIVSTLLIGLFTMGAVWVAFDRFEQKIRQEAKP